jgi:hypothetical protein
MSLNGVLTDTLKHYALQGWVEEAEFYENLEHSDLDPRKVQDALRLRGQ